MPDLELSTPEIVRTDMTAGLHERCDRCDNALGGRQIRPPVLLDRLPSGVAPRPESGHGSGRRPLAEALRGIIEELAK
jgi:hypothetical protein